MRQNSCNNFNNLNPTSRPWYIFYLSENFHWFHFVSSNTRNIEWLHRVAMHLVIGPAFSLLPPITEGNDSIPMVLRDKGGESICLAICQFRGLEGSQTLSATNFVLQINWTRLKRNSEMWQKTTPIALIISTVPVDLSIYSLVVSILVSITYSAWFWRSKSKGSNQTEFCLKLHRTQLALISYFY